MDRVEGAAAVQSHEVKWGGAFGCGRIRKRQLSCKRDYRSERGRHPAALLLSEGRAVSFRARPWRQAGVSIVEMLISITIGLVVIGALVGVYAGGSQATNLVRSQNQMNEDAMAALTLLTNEIRQAGFNPQQASRISTELRNPLVPAPVNPALVTTTVAFFSCSSLFSAATDTTGIFNLVCGTNTASHSLAVVYEVDSFSASRMSDGSPADCVGASVPQTSFTFPTAGNQTYYVVENRYYVSSNALRCVGNGSFASGGQPLVDNVLSMQISLGLSTPTATYSATVAGYLDSSAVGPIKAGEATTGVDASLQLLASNETRWSKVLSVRICIVVQSENAVLEEDTTYYDCDRTPQTTVGRKLRRSYVTTVQLRNRGAT